MSKWVIFNVSSMRQTLPQFTCKPTFARTATSDAWPGPGRVKTLRGITAPGILRLVVTLRAKKCKNSSSAQRYNQIRFRFHTAWAISDQSALQQFGADWDEHCLRAVSFKLTSAPAICGDRSSARKNDFDFGELAKLGIDLD